ncbi:signal transducer and activator of transcription 2 isoform 3-T8 [Alca torda]
MAQWQEVQSLANACLEQVHQLYAGAALPMVVRQCLASWIEDQNWRQAAEPLSSHARMLFHSMLALLGEHLGSPGLGSEDFMLKHNLRKACRDLQAEFEECPEKFANLVDNLLQEERRILRLGQAGEQVGRGLSPPPSPVGPCRPLPDTLCLRRGGLPRRLVHPRRATGSSRSSGAWPSSMWPCRRLNVPSDTWRTCRTPLTSATRCTTSRARTGTATPSTPSRSKPSRPSCRSWTGSGGFTELGQGLFQLRQLLRVLWELRQKVTYERDPLKEETPLLERRLQELLTYLLKSAFVVEQQPSMPNACKRPLVLRTTSKFSARARLLVRLHDRNHGMEARIHIDRDPPKIKGFRKFNILTSSSKTLLAGDSPQDGLVCDFQYLTLREQKDSRSGKGGKGSGEGPLVVTEELHLITFTLAYAYCGLELELETSTLPFIIISNNNQLSSAWASILWFNMLNSVSGDPMDQQFFSKPPPAPWPRLAEVLSWQFESVAERGLSRDHLLMLAEKLFGSKPSPESTLTWPKFSKDGASSFSFWAWLDGILGLLQEQLKELWKNGLILGFVSRKQEKKLLKGKRTGTFLIRFSESVLGGVTCTWVEHPESGRPAFRSVVPYTAVELASLALPDIVRDYQLLMEENIPENPLQFLYPDTPRDEAFGPYYSQRQEGNLLEQKKYLNRRLIRVSSRHANELWQTEEELVAATENLETLQLQPGGLGPQQPGRSGTLQVPAGNLGPQQAMAVSPGMLQPEGSGMQQAVAGSAGMLQPEGSGTLQPRAQGLEPPQPLQVGSGVSGMLQVGTGDLKPQLVPQQVPEGQGTVAPGDVGALHVLPEGLGVLPEVAGNVGMLQPVVGAVEPLLVPKEEGTLPPELRDLDPLHESLDMEELLQVLSEGLEPGSGVLETMEAPELMPNMAEAMHTVPEGLGPGLASADALLNPRDPFLPQLEDSALSPVSSLFTTDFPRLHIDDSDFQ